MSDISLIGLSEDEERRLSGTGLQLVDGDDIGRWRRLRDSYRSAGLWRNSTGRGDPEFCCASADSCQVLFRQTNGGRNMRPDHRGNVANYFAAGYDRVFSQDGQPIRACVVSVDAGGWTFDFATQTRLDKLNCLDFDNQHWRETRKLMHYLFFGTWPYDLASTLLPIKLFAHIRALKCNGGSQPRPPLDGVLGRAGVLDDSPVGALKWKPNPQMYGMCVHHLMAELSVLEPTVIIAQGFAKSYQFSPCTTWSVIRAMDHLSGRPGEDMASAVYGPYPPYNGVARRWNAPWGTCCLFGSYHPAAQGLYSEHDAGGLDAVLKPGIRWLRDRQFRA